LLKPRTWIEILLVAVLAAIFAGRALVPAWRSLNTDFPNYYVAARLYSQGDSLARVYEWIWFQRQKDHTGMEKRIVEFIPHTLYSAMPIVPLASMPPLDAKRYWLVINLLLLGFSGFLLCRMTHLGPMRIAILTLLATQPLHTQFLYGQLHILVLVLLVLSLWLYLKGWPIGSGVTLAFASAIKIYPIVFALYFIRKRQWRVVAGLASSGLLLAALAIYLFGVEVNRVYVEQVLPRVARGESFDPYSLNWNSFTALFYRFFIYEPELNPHPVVNLPLGYAVLQPLTQALLFIPFLWLLTPGRAPIEKEKLEYGTYVVMLLLLSTNPASYHYVVLIVCAVLATDFLLRERRNSQLMLFVLFYIFACLPPHRFNQEATGLAVLIGSSRLVFTLGLFLVLLTVLTSLATETWRKRLQSRSALVFLPMFVLIVPFAALENLRHIKSEGNYAARVASRSGSLLTSDPAVSEKRVAFTMLQLPTYNMGILAGNELSSFAADGDIFHAALIPHSSQALVELAGPTSRIVRIDLDENPDSGGTFPVEVEDGEQPVISPDGQWLAFIREVHGRGSLWIKSLQTHETAEIAAADARKLVGAEYDVLEAAFDTEGSEIIFAAQPRGGPALFTIGRAASGITQITFGSQSRYPALSPDGLWMAYCKFNKGSWQIWLKPRHSGSERQLTTGECNSLSPAWTPDSTEIIYATDCGRGFRMTALAQMRAVP